MNILVLSAGTRNKIVQYFKKTLGTDGKVICTDMFQQLQNARLLICTAELPQGQLIIQKQMTIQSA